MATPDPTLFALATIRKHLPHWLLIVVYCVKYARYILRVKPVPWVLFFVNLIFLFISSCCYVVQSYELFNFDVYGS
jgi:hypothetical protein